MAPSRWSAQEWTAALQPLNLDLPPVGVKFCSRPPDNIQQLDGSFRLCEMLRRAQDGHAFYAAPENHSCDGGHELRPLEDEIEIANYATSAFIYNELDLILRNRGINTVVLAGLATNWVVESSARDAFNRGYFVWTLADCCNSPDREAHDYCVTKTLPMLGVVCQAEDYMRALSSTP